LGTSKNLGCDDDRSAKAANTLANDDIVRFEYWNIAKGAYGYQNI